MNPLTKIPVPVRQTIYGVLGLAIGLEAIWDIVPAALEGKVLSSLSVLGFGVALGNTGQAD